MTPDREAQLETALAKLPRVQLASIRPTPLEPMARLSALLGGPNLYIKRDDLTGLAFGGNKTRMLELSLADAQAQGAEVIVCGSAVQSNYCRQMAAACAKLDLELHLILRPVRDVDHKEVQGNHLLMRLFGANVEVLPDAERHMQAERLRQRAEQLRTQGRKVCVPREGKTIDIDALAYAESALEIVQQSRQLGIEPKYLYCAALDTTQAGIGLGMTYLESGIHVRGFTPFENQPERFEDMARIANQGAGRIGLGITMGPDDFDNDDSFVGERYGVPTPECLEAIRTTARSEGLLLDPVYTGKAMAALFAHVREGKLTKADGPIVFLHTGGYSALFGYAKDVLAK
jgi:1-aminocyclopropane-1-carboxylate deaminase/D-cysteine desulfhydrase-like pyridoxal-dependent ACC family enzyme